MKFKKRLEKKHGKAKSLSILAHKLGRAVYYMLKRDQVFEMAKFLRARTGGSGSAKRLTGAATAGPSVCRPMPSIRMWQRPRSGTGIEAKAARAFDWRTAPLPDKDMIRDPLSCTSPEPDD